MHAVTIPIKTLKALSALLAKDDSRPALTQLGYRNGRLGAADGFVLLTVEANGEMPEGTLIDARRLLGLARTTKRPVEARVYLRDDGSQYAEIGTQEEYVALAAELPRIEGIAPDYDQVIAEYEPSRDQALEVTISAQILKQIATAMLALKADSPAITFTIPPERGSGITYELAGDTQQTWKGVLMPMHAPTPKRRKRNERSERELRAKNTRSAQSIGE